MPACKLFLAHFALRLDLAAGVGRKRDAAWWRRDRQRAAVVVGAVVVIEGRDRQQRLRVEGVHPGKIYEGVGFVVGVAQADGWDIAVRRRDSFSMSLGKGS